MSVAGAGAPSAGPGTVLVDFDGTASTNDVGNRLFDHITGGAWQGVVESWKQGRISSRECLIHECSLARAGREEILAFAAGQPLDPAFGAFMGEVRDRGWETRIVSDGLDLYIRAILEREGLGWIPVESNRVHVYGNRLLPSFPYAGRGCGRCGNCKGGAVAEARPFGRVVFIGDGLSDRCGAETADRVYAKAGRDLARYCRENGIIHTRFASFEALRAEAARGFPAPGEAPVSAGG